MDSIIDKEAEMMADNKGSNGSKLLKLPAVGIVNNVVFSQKEAWAYYKIASVPYDFLSDAGRVGLANNIMVAFSSLASRAGKEVDVHILVTSTPFNVDSWEDQMYRIYDDWNDERLETFDNYIEQQSRVLKSRNYKKKVVYLGVKLFNRGSFAIDDFNFLDFGFKEMIEALKKSISNILVMPDENISDFERNRAKKDEEEVYRTLRAGALKGSRVPSEELLLVMKKMLYPGMPSPYLEVNHGERIGLNDIVLETGSIIEDHRRYLKMRQMVGNEEMEGYRATLSFSKFPPNTMGEPYGVPPFMYVPTMMGLPFTMTARVTLVPSEKMRKDLQKRELEHEDEVQNISGSGQRVSSRLMETQYDLDRLDAELTSDNMPWLSGHYRMTIETPTEELLTTAINELKQVYARTDTVLTWTSGDQLDLLLEEMPGGELRMNDFGHMTNMAMLGVAGFSYGGEVGDPVDEKLILRKGEGKNE